MNQVIAEALSCEIYNFVRETIRDEPISLTTINEAFTAAKYAVLENWLRMIVPDLNEVHNITEHILNDERLCTEKFAMKAKDLLNSKEHKPE